jgi:glutamate/tyrosine decarboxylase-like PLP-dependent enzyme
MPRPDPDATARLLDLVRAHALRYLRGLDARPVGATASSRQLHDGLDGPLPEDGADPADVLAALARDADRTMTATTAARFFGFVVGGVLPAAMAADMLAAVWDQNAGLHVIGPLAAATEETTRSWLADLLGLPRDVSLGFVTGGQMANTTGLVVARHHVLAAVGWDVERDGLTGAPPVTVVAGAERHSTVDRAMRFIGLGSRPVLIAADGNGAMRPDALRRALEDLRGPTIVCAQVGNVNTGAVDPVGVISDLAHARGAWVHVDGAFGLWAACTPRLRDRVAGLDQADSWAVDAHKWLNVPYDSGMIFTAHPASHRAGTGTDPATASYLVFDAQARDGMQWTPEASRRARGFAVWAALRSLGRRGVVELIDRCCAMAARFAELLAAEPGITVHNEVVLNQVLVGFAGVDTADLVAEVQRDGTCWVGGTTWRGEHLLRISVSNWQTDVDDVDRSVRAIVDCYHALRT